MTNSAEDIAWAAGLFEGEGSCFVSGSKNRQPRVVLQMTDEDVVRRFAVIMDRGAVRRYAQVRSEWSDYWQWSVQARDDVLHVLSLLWPHLGERRKERATEVMERAVKMGDPRNGGGRKSTGLCKRGHDLNDPRHVYVHAKSGKRHCRTCRLEHSRGRVRRRAAA